MNIVYGGSFNPPTVAHEAIIKELKRKFNPKNLIILPTGNSYVRKDLLDFKHRYEMLKLISNDIILSLENEEKKYLGTVGALDILSLQYDDLYFVMGADNLIDIKTWIEYERLLKTYNFIVITRDDIDIYDFIDKNLSEYKSHFKFINLSLDVSSSKIREDVDKNKDLLNPLVYEYIKKNHLYEEW